MPFVLAKKNDLFSFRSATIREMLIPLKDPHRGVFCNFYRPQIAGGKILAAHGGVNIETPFSEWRFQSFAIDIRCQYFELWKPKEVGRLWYLDKAYLNVFSINRSERKLEELLCLHCDPCDDSSEPLCFYKRGPHLHVKKAMPPIPKSHLALNRGHLDKVLSSIGELTKALKHSILMIRHEILDQI